MWILVALHSIFATTYTLGKAALSYVQPLFYVACRMLLCGMLLLSYVWIKTGKLWIQRTHIWLFFQLAFFQIYLTYVLSYMALPYVETAKWALMFNLTPFFIAFFSYFYFQEKITLKKIIGFLIGFFGLIPVLFDPQMDQGMKSFLGISWPELIILFSVLSYAYGWVVSKRIVKQQLYSSSFINGIAMTFGGMGCLLMSIFTEHWEPTPILSLKPFLLILSAIVLVTIFTFNINTYLLKWYTATLITFVGFVDPLYAALYGWLFLNETIYWHFFVSVFAVFIGLYIFYREELRQGYIRTI